MLSKAEQMEEAWERQMLTIGYERYHAGCRKAAKGKSESNTSYGISLTKELIIPVKEYIKEEIKEWKGKAGKKPTAYEYLSELPLDVVAYIAVKTVIDSISGHQFLTSVASRIGNKIEDQIRLDILENQIGHLNMLKIERWVKNTGDLNYRNFKRAYIFAEHRKAETEEVKQWQLWPAGHKTALGTACIDAILSTGYLQLTQEKKFQGNTKYYIRGTEALFDWIKVNKDAMEFLTPDKLPTLIKPRDWSNCFNGGYHNKHVRQLTPMVKSQHLKEIDTDMSEVYEAVNYLQRTEWCVNKKVYEIFEKQMKLKHGIGLPGNVKVNPPDCPLPDFEPQGDRTNKEYSQYKKSVIQNLSIQQKKAFKEWKVIAQKCHQEEKKRISKMIQAARTLNLVKKLVDKDRFYFVYQLDFVSRFYPLGTGLSPIGIDYEKAMLQFKQGVKLGKHGWYHLRLHTAGVYGIDKVSLDSRIEWFEQNKELITAIGKDPENTTDLWKQADKPYCFLAACLEAAEVIQLYKNNEHEYISHLPINQDGSCNGIQHYSAMLKDPIGARAVNLIDSEVPSDIYQITADNVKEQLEKTLRTGYLFKGKTHGIKKATEEELEFCKVWLNDYGIDRGLTKKSTMIVPYGGTKLTCCDSIEDYVSKEDIKRKQKNPDYINPFMKFGPAGIIKAVRLIHHLVWKALDTVVVGARVAMDFLAGIGKGVQKAEKKGDKLIWKTPVGFKVIQAKRDYKQHRIRTKLNGSIVVLSDYTDSIGYDKNKQVQGFAPNFVHSLDAAHLVKTLTLCDLFGIPAFMPIHDSYGVHAGHTETLHILIRSSFVELYKKNILKDLWTQITDKKPELVKHLLDIKDIKFGKFDLKEVNNSTHFFR